LGKRNNPSAEENIARLLEFWRTQKGPIIHVQHCSKNPQSPLFPGKPGYDFKQIAVPVHREPIVQKEVNSAFIGTNLMDLLANLQAIELVIVGITTNHCVSTTARMASNLGFKTTVISDATACFETRGIDNEMIPADLIHKVSLANLKDEFAAILTTQAILTSLSKTL
jgi:nicotinamidase-related amidase